MNTETKKAGTATPAKWFLTALLLVSIWNQLDRAALGILQEPIKRDFGLSDFELGLLGGPAFAFLYALLGIPFGRLAERVNRVRLIATVFTIWSVATALCGLAAGFLSLLAARVIVGIGEAGCSPSAHSLISDRVVPEKRSWAIAVFMSGISLGSLIAALAGGAIAQHFGWRVTFYVLGATGFALAVLFALTVREAPRSTAASSTPPFLETMRFLIGKRVVRHVAFAIMVGAMLSLTTAQYLTSFFMRTHGLVIGQAILRLGLIFGFCGAVGIYLGGYIGNRLALRDPGAATSLMGWCYLAAMPLTITAFLAPDPRLATGLLMLGVGLQAGYLGPTFAVLHASVAPGMRGTAVAVVLLVSNFIGYGFGPPIVGKVSDLLGRYFANGSASSQQFCASNSWFAVACANPAAAGLQFALALLALANVWAFFHLKTLSRLHREEQGAGEAAVA